MKQKVAWEVIESLLHKTFEPKVRMWNGRDDRHYTPHSSADVVLEVFIPNNPKTVKRQWLEKIAKKHNVSVEYGPMQFGHTTRGTLR